MCALCGVLGGEDHWTAAAGRPETFGEVPTRRAERQEQVRVTNAVLGVHALRLDDWQGAAFLLSGATGGSEIVPTLPAVWAAAARLLGRPIDPLDPRVLVRLSARGGR